METLSKDCRELLLNIYKAKGRPNSSHKKLFNAIRSNVSEIGFVLKFSRIGSFRFLNSWLISRTIGLYPTNVSG